MSLLKFSGLLLILIILLLGISVIALNRKTTMSPSITSPTPPSLKVISWIPYWDQQNAVADFRSHINDFTDISLFWYYLDQDGTVKTYSQAHIDPSILTLAHQHGVKVLALVANLPDSNEGGDWDYKRVNKVIGTEQGRQKHIQALLDLVNQKGFDGIDIDYEALQPSQRDNFSLFITELADALHKQGKILGVAIHPKTSENNPQEDNGSHAQDLVSLAKSADQLYFMTYLEHGSYSDPGPPGSIDWITSAMQYAVDDLNLPKNKVFMGIGLMGQEWVQKSDGSSQGQNSDLTFQDIYALTQKRGITPQWDDTSRTPHFEYYDDNGQRHIIWYENSDSVKQRINLARHLGVGGIAFWRIGGEDQQIWQYLQ